MLLLIRLVLRYLAIGNFHTVGHCPDYPSFTEKDDTGSSFSTDGKSFSTDGKRKDVDELDDGDTTPTMKKRKLDVEESKAVVVPKEDEHHVDGVMKAQTADIEKTNLSEIIDPHVDANKENLSPKDATDHDDTAEDSSPSTNTSTGSQTVTATSCTEDSQSLSTSQGEADQDDSFPEGSLRFPMDFYIREVCAHYNRCHRYDFVERRCMSMSSAYTSSSDDTAATTEYPPIVDPLEPDMVLDPCGQMLVATQSLSQPALLAIEAGKPVKKIPRHLDLIYLSTIPTLRPRQNSVCDIVACIDWVSPSVGYAAGIGPKRDIRITDQSTDKRVLLSVFDDPTNFTPSIGTVVLFRNLKTHKWDGYSLNAYTQDCTGWDWFLPNPFWFKACGSGTRAQHLRTWWREVRFPEKMRQSNGGAEDILVTGCSAHEVCQGTAGRIDLEAIENRKAYERWCRQEDGDEDDDD